MLAQTQLGGWEESFSFFLCENFPTHPPLFRFEIRVPNPTVRTAWITGACNLPPLHLGAQAEKKCVLWVLVFPTAQVYIFKYVWLASFLTIHFSHILKYDGNNMRAIELHTFAYLLKHDKRLCEIPYHIYFLIDESTVSKTEEISLNSLQGIVTLFPFRDKLLFLKKRK